jgi:phage major head subunit gpT-like protein
MSKGILGNSVFENASTTFRGVFDDIFKGAPAGPWNELALVVPTDSVLNETNVFGAMPVVREWIGQKQYQSRRAYTQTVRIKKYEQSTVLDRLDVQADRTGQIGRHIQQFVQSANETIYDKVVHDVAFSNSGNGPTGYDGVALLSGSHPHAAAGGTSSNLSSTALSFAQFDAVMQACAALKLENGEPMGIMYDTLIVGPKLQKIAKEITQSNERIIAVANDGLEAGTRVAAASIPNVFGGGQLKLIVDPRLTGTQDDYYYFIDSSKSAKPFVLYEFRAPEAIDQFAMDSEGRFNFDEMRMSVEADFAVAAGAWQTIYGGVL